MHAPFWMLMIHSPSSALIEPGDEPFGRGQAVALLGEIGDDAPVGCVVQPNPHPTMLPNIRRDEVAVRLGARQRLLRAGLRLDPQRRAPIVRMPHDEYLVAHAKRRPTYPLAFGGFGE